VVAEYTKEDLDRDGRSEAPGFWKLKCGLLSPTRPTDYLSVDVVCAERIFERIHIPTECFDELTQRTPLLCGIGAAPPGG